LARCDTCGNDYDKSFQIVMSGRTQTFDSFECAIQSLAPTCAHCGCRILGHGVEEKGSIRLMQLSQVPPIGSLRNPLAGAPRPR
jgi:hypothetical protein